MWWYWHRTGWYVCVVVGGPVQSALVLGGVRSAETGRPLRWCLVHGGVRLTSDLGGFTQPPSLVGDCESDARQPLLAWLMKAAAKRMANKIIAA